MEYMEYNEKKNLIKIIKKIVLVIVIGILLNSYLTSPSKAYKALDSYFKKTYGEEFVIKGIGRRRLKDREWYEAGIVFPKSYIDTPKENDRYYWGRGFAEIEAFGFDVGDSYGGVLLNESANEFYGKKLKELFGDNVLPVLEIDGEYKFTDFVREYSRVSKTISGGIYIFGRVESDKDREWYRKQIYEFVQFMKETGTFEYVAMQIKILDERCLTNYFDRNKKELLEAKQKYTTSKDYLDFRENFFKKSNNEYEQMTQEEKNIKMDSFNKGEFNDYGNNTYFSLYHMGLTSPKFKDSEPRDKSRRKEYNSISDVQLLNSVKIMYGEYYRADNGDIIEK